jgi:hypothetical protein
MNFYRKNKPTILFTDLDKRLMTEHNNFIVFHNLAWDCWLDMIELENKIHEWKTQNPNLKEPTKEEICAALATLVKAELIDMRHTEGSPAFINPTPPLNGDIARAWMDIGDSINRLAADYKAATDKFLGAFEEKFSENA